MDLITLGLFLGALGLLCLLVIIKDYLKKSEISKVNRVIFLISIFCFVVGILVTIAGLFA